MTIFEQFATDAKKEVEGARVTFAPNDDGTIPTVILARSGNYNKRYAKALEKATKPYRRQIQLGSMDDSVAESIYKKVFAETVVLRWENIQGQDNINIPFSCNNVLDIFEKLPEFYEELQKQAGSIATFRAESSEDDAKN